MAQPFAAVTAGLRLAQDQARWRAEAEARLAAAVEADRLEDERQAAATRQHEAAMREQAELEEAGVRAAVEADLRLGGIPEAQVRELSAEAMKRRHLARVVEAAERGPATEAELRDHFRRMGRAAGQAE